MTAEQLREAWKAEPFRKFTVHLGDGRNLPVRHRDFLMMSPTGRTFIVYQPDGSHNVVDLFMVTDLHIGGNGSGQRRIRRRRG